MNWESIGWGFLALIAVGGFLFPLLAPATFFRMMEENDKLPEPTAPDADGFIQFVMERRAERFYMHDIETREGTMYCRVQMWEAGTMDGPPARIELTRADLVRA